MRAYLVRTVEAKDLVGIFVADSLPNLCWLIDECTDADICECALLPEGGLYWDTPAAKVPAKIEDHEDDTIPWAKNTTTESWWRYIYDDDARWVPLKLVARAIPVLAALKEAGM